MFKQVLTQKMEMGVRTLFSGTLISSEITDSGVTCDFSMDAPMNPERMEALAAYLSREVIPCVYALSGFSGVYLSGDASSEVLQRVWAAAFSSQAEMDAHNARVRDAEARDHKKLGAQLQIYSSSDAVGPGLIMLNPKGAVVRYLLEQFSQSAHILNDYQWAYTPHIGRAGLWKTSGHLDFYKDSMYSEMDIDGEAYYLKPMNCPFHIEIYKSAPRSYRELPYRIAEFGTVYRYELSGTLNGLTRVRGFTQDDAHIFATPEQVEAEVKRALAFSLYVLRAFGLSDFQPYVSTKPPKKSIGEDALWDQATEVLKRAVSACGLEYEIDEGGGAFYGPKIDLKVKDAMGREWQLSTIQFDFNLPERFQMKYIGSDGKEHTPLMVHRALFGSIERFLALLIEHHRGDFPLWLAPVQFAVVPIAERHEDFCRALTEALIARGLRAEAMDASTHMRERIKRAEAQKVPFVLIAGDRDVAQGVFSARRRGAGELGQMDMDALCASIEEELALGRPKRL